LDKSTNFVGRDIAIEKEREIIGLWNQLLEKQGQSTASVLQKIERALVERERDAA
jgi:hypothetical protein